MPAKRAQKTPKATPLRALELPVDEPSSDVKTELAIVVKMTGGNFVTARVVGSDAESAPLVCRIPGKFRRRKFTTTKITEGDTILISIRSFQDNVADVEHIYTDAEARQLQKRGLIPKPARQSDDSSGAVDDLCDAFDFTDI